MGEADALELRKGDAEVLDEAAEGGVVIVELRPDRAAAPVDRVEATQRIRSSAERR
jgi:hypothetical protein